MVGKWACWPRRYFHDGHWGRHHAGRSETEDAAQDNKAD
jgi:hypothetical protein